MYIKVKVTAGSKKEEIKKKNEDSYIIFVKEPAERNLANKRVIELVASFLRVSTKKIRIISGHQNSSKILSINLSENLL